MTVKSSKTAIVIADDHAMFRQGLRSLIERHPGMRVIGEAADTGAAAEQVAELRPQILVIDLSMPQGDVLDVISALVHADAQLRVVVVTMHDDPILVRSAFASGADGFVVKRSASEILLEALDAVRAGKRYLDPSLGAPPKEKGTTPSPLSRREREVLRLLARGLTYREAGDLLRVSERTIESHRRHIMEKLDLRTRSDLTRYALATGLIGPGDVGRQP